MMNDFSILVEDLESRETLFIKQFLDKYSGREIWVPGNYGSRGFWCIPEKMSGTMMQCKIRYSKKDDWKTQFVLFHKLLELDSGLWMKYLDWEAVKDSEGNDYPFNDEEEIF